jgi:hypothetical protein
VAPSARIAGSSVLETAFDRLLAVAEFNSRECREFQMTLYFQ